MSRIQEIKQELEKIAHTLDLTQSRVGELRAELDHLKKPSRWYSPEECKWYLHGPVMLADFDNLYQKDLSYWFTGFPTESDAEYYQDIPRTMRPLAKALRELSNKGEWIQWTNEIQPKWIAVYSHITKAWYPINVVDQHQHQALYAPSEKIMLQALEIAQLDAPL